MTIHEKCIPAHIKQTKAVPSPFPITRRARAQEHAVLQSIEHLIRIGASVILLHERTKRPIGNDWSIAPIASLDKLTREYREGMNVGIRLGKWSMIDGLFLHVVDVDIHDPERADEALDTVEDLFPGYDVWSWPRVKSGSGGKSCHIYFLTDKPFPSRKLAKSKEMVTGEDGKPHRAWEIELFGTGKQVVLPPSIHPISGKAYEWIVPFDPSAKLPYIAEELIEQLVYPEEDDEAEYDSEPIGLDVEEIEAALPWLDKTYWCDEFEGWRNLGMALKHEFRGSETGFRIWDAYSKESPKYDKKQREHWDSYKGRARRPITMRTVMKAAKEAKRAVERAGYADEFEDEETAAYHQELRDQFDDLDLEEAPVQLDVPKRLLRPPGKLGLATDYYNDTAEKPQPQFAVQVALAIGSVTLSRNFVTNKRNYPTLYFLNVAPTAAGKEHFKTVIDDVLEAAGVGSLIAPEEFSSGAAIFWHLTESPRTISVTDEYGIYLSTGRDANNTLKRETRKLQLELFGRPHGIVRGIGYSMARATKEQIEAARNRKVIRPAFVQAGMTTPETFYEAISNKEVQSGYLNRFLIVRSLLGIQLSREDVPDAEVPPELIEWVKKYVNAHGGTEDDNDHSFGKPDYVFPPRVVPFDDECLCKLREYEKELIKKMNAMNQENGMGSLYGRTREIAMRLALIIAVSCESKIIRLKHLEWAWDYVSYYHKQMIEDFSANLGKTEMEGVCDEVVQMVTLARASGLTKREIARKCRSFSRLSIRDGEEVLARLERNGQIRLEEIKTGRVGRKRRAYVAMKRRATNLKENDNE
ncbi:bifunctional DNA primase/polymerase [Microvirga makkahensis]|uniref:DUF3987 domain-containing protein n=1 Tax=Microvirga makkahensis TaxID=1128670 RepID=A0A7X3SQI3_9HYPH|nr:bifunctional DNA primase/polymerase [Microvirga makkahensis]MXQ13547.1 DUF3987 domain-containing protein [Microvirga makkahensis]